jgi:hypothetical protein
LVFQFRYQLSSTNSQLRPLKIYTGNLRRNEVRLFSSMTSTAPDLAVPLSYAEIEGQSATINVVPSPGSVVLLGTSAVVWVSRRRRPDASITSAQRV